MNLEEWKAQVLESLSEKAAARMANMRSQINSRDRDNDFIGGELAKHDIHASFAKPTSRGDVEGTMLTKTMLPAEQQDKAKEVIKNLGFHKTHHVVSYN